MSTRFNRSESVKNFDDEVEKLRKDMKKRREDFWEEAETRQVEQEAEKERWLKRTDDLWNDMVDSSRKDFESFGKFDSDDFDSGNGKDEVRRERTETYTSRTTPDRTSDRDQEGREFLANFRSKLRSDHSRDNLDDVFKTLDDFVERRKSRHSESTSEKCSSKMAPSHTTERCKSRTETVKEEKSSARPSKATTDSGRTTPSAGRSTPSKLDTRGSGNDEELNVSHNIVGNQRNIEVNSRKETKDGDCYSVREVKQTISVPAEADLDEVTSTLPTDCKEMLKKAALKV